jgi:hypothetical protein
MRRILAAQARPKRLLDELADLHKDDLDPSLRQQPIGPRPTSEYQHLLSPEQADETPSAQEPPAPEESCGPA